jgi:hypothetical protein
MRGAVIGNIRSWMSSFASSLPISHSSISHFIFEKSESDIRGIVQFQATITSRARLCSCESRYRLGVRSISAGFTFDESCNYNSHPNNKKEPTSNTYTLQSIPTVSSKARATILTTTSKMAATESQIRVEGTSPALTYPSSHQHIADRNRGEGHI